MIILCKNKNYEPYLKTGDKTYLVPEKEAREPRIAAALLRCTATPILCKR